MNKPAPSLVSEGPRLRAVALPACLPACLAKLTMTISQQ